MIHHHGTDRSRMKLNEFDLKSCCEQIFSKSRGPMVLTLTCLKKHIV
jgi:hypothetical protein